MSDPPDPVGAESVDPSISQKVRAGDVQAQLQTEVKELDISKIPTGQKVKVMKASSIRGIIENQVSLVKNLKNPQLVTALSEAEIANQQLKSKVDVGQREVEGLRNELAGARSTVALERGRVDIGQLRLQAAAAKPVHEVVSELVVALAPKSRDSALVPRRE